MITKLITTALRAAGATVLVAGVSCWLALEEIAKLLASCGCETPWGTRSSCKHSTAASPCGCRCHREGT